jgi:hypothetical protein
LRLAEWYAQATQGGEWDICFDGRAIEKWAASQVVGEPPKVRAHYDVDEVWSALIASMSLFNQITS